MRITDKCMRYVRPPFATLASSAKADGSRSNVWKHFEKVKDLPKAKCKLCSKELSYRGGTMNLHDHLTSQHPACYEPAMFSQVQNDCHNCYHSAKFNEGSKLSKVM